MEISLEDIQQKFDSLPEDLKWAIVEADVDEKIVDIGQTHKLNYEQIGQLSLETHAVMMGFVHPDNFAESVKASLQLSEEENRSVVNDVNEKILKEVKEKLMDLHRKKEDVVPKPPEEKIISQEEEKETKTIEDKEHEVLKSNGIEIIDKEKEAMNKKIMETVSAQKLIGSFQVPPAKTEYSLNNLSKGNEKGGVPVPPPLSNQINKTPLAGTIAPTTSSVAKTSPSYSVNSDPYRIKPEE